MLRVGLVSHNILTKKVLNLNKKLVPSCVAPTPTVGRLFGPHPNGHMVQATVNKDNG